MIVKNCKNIIFLTIILILTKYKSFQQECDGTQNEITCYECNSLENSNCTVNPTAILTEKKCKICDKCVTAIVEDITYRGCLSTFDPSIPINLLKYVKTCNNKNLCNNEIYPLNRLRCYKCSGDVNCVNSQNDDTLLTPCLYYRENDQCFTDVIDEIDAVRGCQSDGNYTFGPGVQFCNENGCNNENGIITLNCVNCSSKDSRGCKRLPFYNDNDLNCTISHNKCTVKYLLGRPEEKCFVYHNDDTVIRGCTRFSGLLHTETEYFDECKGNLCNQNCLKPLKCYSCDSGIDSKCKTPDLNSSSLVNCGSEDSSCHTCEHEDGNIIRGCGKPKFESNNCYQCYNSNGCNSNNIRKCYNCTSEYDKNCLNWLDENDIDQQICPKSNNLCVTFVDYEKRKVLRGCFSENFNCNNKLKCYDCDGNLCNKGVFPEKRIKCYTCKNSDDCDKEQKPDNGLLQVCRNYRPNDSCYAYAVSYTDGNNIRMRMNRGCQSDDEDYSSCKKEGDVKCKVCSKNECNSFPLQSKPKLSCIKCEKNDTACAWGYDANKNSSCTLEFFYYSEESCYVKKFSDHEIQRGCSLDDGICPSGATNCTFCSKAACNNQNVITQSCLQCDSGVPDQSKKCVSGKDFPASVCQGVIPYENRGCYTKHNDGKTIRGCAAQLEGELQNCKNENNKNACEFCEKDGCNNSSGNIISVTLTTILLSIFTISIFK